MKELEENKNTISIIIPCRNEEKFIGKCLDSIIEQDYPKDKLEVLVIDGMSEDRTKEILEKYIKQYPYIKLLENPKKYTPFALNIGIKQAKGKIIIRMDAHSTCKADYISNCLKYLNEYNTDNVGGIWKIVPGENTIIAKAIALVSSSMFGAGNAYYRSGYSKGIKWVDTVFGGCYKKEIFEKIGFFNEKLIRSQDMEFNIRLKKSGGKILLAPEIVSYYYPKSNLKDFFIHNFKDGVWVTYPLKFGIRIFSWRHLIPLIFVLSIFFVIPFVLYILVNLFFSFRIALKEKDLRYFFVLPIAFITRHFGYGLGSIWGLVKILIWIEKRVKIL